MASMDSLDNVHGHSGQSPVSPWIKSSETSQIGQCPWIQWTLSMDSMDIVHGFSGQSVSPDGLDNVHGQSPLSPWTGWTLFIDSMDFVQSDLVKTTETTELNVVGLL